MRTSLRISLIFNHTTSTHSIEHYVVLDKKE